MHKREKKIEDRLYQLLLPPVRQAMPLCSRLAVLIGPSLAILGKDANKKGLSEFTAVLSRVDPKELDILMMEAVMISKLCCDSEPISTEIDFGKHFSNLRGEVYPVTFWVLWECVKDFFPGAEAFTQIVKTNLGKE